MPQFRTVAELETPDAQGVVWTHTMGHQTRLQLWEKPIDAEGNTKYAVRDRRTDRMYRSTHRIRSALDDSILGEYSDSMNMQRVLDWLVQNARMPQAIANQAGGGPHSQLVDAPPALLS